jgi:predicted O-methyltransferase YrrM
VNFIVESSVEEYAEQHTSPDGELFERLAAETHEKTTVPQMMVGRIEGRFLGVLVRSLRARRVLEVGTFTGYSSISMALALPAGGRVITCDVNEETTAIARRYAEEAGVADRIDFRLGPALETVAQLDGPFDLVFIDADKERSADYLALALERSRAGTLIVADNVVRGGAVVDADDADPRVVGVRRLVEAVAAEPRLVGAALQTVGLKGWDGMVLALVV